MMDDGENFQNVRNWKCIVAPVKKKTYKMYFNKYKLLNTLYIGE